MLACVLVGSVFYAAGIRPACSASVFKLEMADGEERGW
jgi:hypothetical protein